MERDYMDGKENIYFASRKNAAKYNDKLNSREAAAEMLGFSPSTLANYELGVTKCGNDERLVWSAGIEKLLLQA